MARRMRWLAALTERVDRWRADAPARQNRALGTHCFYCGVTFEDLGSRQRTIDHRLPRSQGGNDRLINVVFACRACNQRKGDQSEVDFGCSAWLQQRRRQVNAEDVR